MDRGVLVAKGYNLFLLLLLVVQFVMLTGILIILAYYGSGSVLSILTVASGVSVFVLCLPLAALQFLSSRDKGLRTIFLGMVGLFILSSLSVVAWFLAPALETSTWFPDFAMLLALLSYVPMIVSLVAVSQNSDLKIEPYNKAAVVFISVVSVSFIVFFTLANAGHAQADLFRTLDYSASSVFDIILLALASMLVITHLSGKLRYLLSIVLITYLISTAGDILMLIDSMGLADTFDYANLCFAIMAIFTGMALLAYSLGNVKVVTVEEVSRKLDEAVLLTSDLVAQSPVAICICDVTGTVVVTNHQFLELCGKSRQETGARLNIFRDLPGLGPAFPGEAQRVLRGETITMDDLSVDRTGLGPAFIRLKMFPTHSADGRVNNAVLILDDITERKAFEDQLIGAKKQTELYVDLMGHDVNNMNQIAIGFLELAEEKVRHEGRLTEADLFLVTKPIEALMTNSRLIYNIRKLQQEKAGAYRTEPIDVGKMLAGLVPRYSDIPGRDVKVSLEVTGSSTVLANELLGEVFGNLIGNAIRHSRDAVNIYVSVGETAEEGAAGGGKAYCMVAVADDGPGISDQAKAKLFDRLAIDSSRAQGSGFGLCLSKILVEDFGGRLRVEDRVPGDYSQGARFVVLLPLIGKADPAESTPGLQLAAE